MGVTAVRFRGGKIEGIESRLVPLDGYAPDASYQAEVDRYYADPELNKPVGAFAGPADKWGLANWMAASVADEADADVGFYHIGGVRLDSIPAGGVGAAKAVSYTHLDVYKRQSPGRPGRRRSAEACTAIRRSSRNGPRA